MNPYNGTVIDIHTHIFNAHCLPVSGALQSKGVSKQIAELLKPIINELTGKIDDYVEGGEKELSDLLIDIEKPDIKTERLARVILKVASSEILRNVQNRELIKPHFLSEKGRKHIEPSLINDNLFRSLKEIEDYVSYDQKKAPAVKMLLKYISEKDIADMSRISETLRPGIHERFFDPLKYLLDKIYEISSDGVRTGINTLRFIIMVMLSTEAIVRKLFNTYCNNNHNVQAIQLMMDMEKAYDEKPVIFFKDQIPLIARIMKDINTGKKRLFGFVAFDPRRLDALALVKKGIRAGNNGIKLYPPLGYRPAGNNDNNLDKRLIELFDYCINVNNDIPIIVHSTAFGFELSDGTGLNSNPVYWQPVFEMKNRKYLNLRLSYAHAGGMGKIRKGQVVMPGWGVSDNEWYKEGDGNFARTVVDHCRKYPNVYCDVAYFDELLRVNDDTAGMLENFKRHFKREMTGSEGGPFKFSDKVMYGSDWHMPEMIPRVNEFLDFFIELFNDPDLVGFRDNFFCRNAMKFLKRDS